MKSSTHTQKFGKPLPWGVNHRSRGETVKAYIVPEEGANLTVPGSRGLLSPETGFLQGASLDRIP